MKLIPYFTLFLFLVSLSCSDKSNAATAAKEKKGIKTEEITYNIDGKNYRSFVAFNSSSAEARPVVMVIPEWWGLTGYVKERAEQLAGLGYFALAVDYYGDGKVVETPEEAATLSEQFYKIPVNAKLIFDGARAQLLKYPEADYGKIAVIGYCFGGSQALNMARQESDLKGAVSFHGNLMTGVKPRNNRVPMLICNGEADSYVSAEEIAAFKKEMDSAKVKYTFINYPNALHSFTNPGSTALGRKFNMKIAYNKTADERSWSDMSAFLKEIFR
ncbi:dienelactone hydrolase family protein [Kaistella palustris]|uniref:dienelactone hydrolase family protein n=1 Tax=Kaistella palustris TaxID=493376 RepID=UPI00040F23E4|nr:dienelactone hydrolase family protein [Kaistella palustris]